MLIPPFLQVGSIVRLVSPAGVIDADLVEGAAKCLNNWGLSVRIGKSATLRYGRFAGTSLERLNDLQEALDDSECDAIFCTRGGYGTIQLIDNLNWDAFKKHPKWLIGYSDITMLHAFLSKNGVASIHGGMAKALAESLKNKQEHVSFLKNALFGSFPKYSCEANPLNRFGAAEGPLFGGNLSILYSLRGTPYDCIPEKSILFIEDIGERPYVVDRMMHNLKLGGILSHLAGLIIGNFSDFEEDPLFGKTVQEIIADAVSEYSYPLCFDFPVGHDGRNLPMICGADVQLHVGHEGVHLQF
jgi:muramoyltetrapeptide carboxypeptidase